MRGTYLPYASLDSELGYRRAALLDERKCFAVRDVCREARCEVYVDCTEVASFAKDWAKYNLHSEHHGFKSAG